MVEIELQSDYFDRTPRELFKNGDISASIFRNRNSVDILSLTWGNNKLDILPFQGHQIWSATLNGRNITMKSEVDEPVVTTDYLRNYGAFLVHCGATAMGGPSPDDSHPLHGELPNSKYNRAWLTAGIDNSGNEFVEVHGEYKHQVAMTVNYVAHPVIRISTGSQVDVSMTITNKSKAPMDMMYLAHINFAPVIGSAIEATHKFDTESIKVRSSFPSHIHVDEQTQSALKELAVDPQRSAYIDYDSAYDPEAVMSIDYVADTNGYAHTLQVHPDGTSDYVKHQPSQAPHCIRAIQLTDHHECVALVLPATAGVEGYLKEKELGRVISLDSDQDYTIDFSFDSLDVDATNEIRRHIAHVMERN